MNMDTLANSSDSLMAPLETLLTKSVQLATGHADALPRPGQLMLAQDVLRALVGKTGMAGIAPTGTGKSLAHMSPAALVAVQSHERTVISTDSLALQSQFMTKDLPVVAEAVQEIFGFELRYAVLKGVSNYVDPVKAMGLAQSLLGTREKDFRRLITALEGGKLNPDFKPDGIGEFSPKRQLAKLAAWALGVYLDDREHGDRDSCHVTHTTDDWRLVSASSDEKANESDLGYAPKADLAKELAGDSHIVVTNHTLLGMQAARALPIVFGSKKLGRFHNLIVDEGHTLPAQVRSQGASEVSAWVVMRAGRAASRVIDDRWIMEDTERLAEVVTTQLKQSVAHLKGFEDALRIGPEDVGPIHDIYEDIIRYTSSVDDVLERAESLSDEPKFLQKVRRARAAMERLESDAGVAIEPTTRIARWVTRGVDKMPPAFESSPVDVSPMINAQLWNIDPKGDLTKQEAEEWERRMKEAEESEDGEMPEVRVPLGVAVVSATLPAHFHIQVALPREAGEYESPFGEAYSPAVPCTSHAAWRTRTSRR